MREKNQVGYKSLLLVVFNSTDSDDILHIRDEDARIIEKMLGELDPREEKVIRMRFALGMEFHTLEQVGAAIGKDRERVRQIEAKALRKLKHPVRAQHLEILFRSTLENKLKESLKEIAKLQEDKEALASQVKRDKETAQKIIDTLHTIGAVGDKINIIPSVLAKSIFDFELSVRTHNCVKNVNVKTVGDLIQKTEQEMLKAKNFGRKGLVELKAILATMNLRFGMKTD